MTADADEAVRLRRLRAALGASAAALLAADDLDAARLLRAEAAFLIDLAGATDPAALTAIWRDLRNQALALAANLPPTADSVALLERRLAADGGDGSGLPPPGGRQRWP